MELQDQRQLHQELEGWLSTRGSKPDLVFFSDEDKQESRHIEGSYPEGETIINQDPEREISPKNMVIFKWSVAVKGPRIKVDGPLCGVLYREDHGYIVLW